MSEQASKDRLQPYLLDRLRDDEPGNRLESRDRRAFTLSKFRQAVLRDLSWLLNARGRRSDEGLAGFPLVERSVLNYGITDLTGVPASTIPPAVVEQMVKRAIEAFEPRIIRSSLTVRYVAAAEATRGYTVALEIRAMVWALPVPESLYVKTEIDLETGDCSLREA